MRERKVGVERGGTRVILEIFVGILFFYLIYIFFFLVITELWKTIFFCTSFTFIFKITTDT